MTELSADTLNWLWDYEQQTPRVRHWPAVTQGAVHFRDVSDLSELRKAATGVKDVDEWADLYNRVMSADHFAVAVDKLSEMIDHNRENCLGDAANLKGFSQSVFALARGEVLTQLPFPARLALLTDGLAHIETSAYEHDPVEALEELTVVELQMLAAQSDRISGNQRKAELVAELAAAEDRGEVELPLGDISPAPPLHGWLAGLVEQYVQALRTALEDPVYPDVFREAVYHQAISQAPINPLKRALELEYWAVLERGIAATEEDPTEAGEVYTTDEAEPLRVGQWRPRVAPHSGDAPVVWIAVGLLLVAWLFF